VSGRMRTDEHMQVHMPIGTSCSRVQRAGSEVSSALPFLSLFLLSVQVSFF
jgi:hypothetical protein